MLMEIEGIDYLKLENCINGSSSKPSEYPLFTTISSPSTSNPNPINTDYHRQFFMNEWKNTPHRNQENYLEDRSPVAKINLTPNRATRTSPLMAETSSGEEEGVKKLLSSFRKLCSNFEANHKKLAREGYSAPYRT